MELEPTDKGVNAEGTREESSNPVYEKPDGTVVEAVPHFDDQGVDRVDERPLILKE